TTRRCATISPRAGGRAPRSSAGNAPPRRRSGCCALCHPERERRIGVGGAPPAHTGPSLTLGMTAQIIIDGRALVGHRTGIGVHTAEIARRLDPPPLIAAHAEIED